MKRFVFFCLVLLAGTSAYPQSGHQRLQKYFSALAQNQGFTGNVLIADHGKVVYEKSFGYADPATKRLNRLDTPFPVESITKTFVATSILQLQEKGKLNVDDPVVKYLSEFPYTAVTIKQLLSHTSGLPEFYGFYTPFLAKHPDTVLTNKDFIHLYRVMDQPLQFTPGSQFNYNNANFVVLAIIVSHISGLAINDYLSRHILKPLGMNRTFQLDFFRLPAGQKKRAAAPYYKPHLYSDRLVRTDTIPYLAKDARHAHFSGHGDMISTLHDLLLYDQALYSGKLLKKETLDLAYTPVKLNNGQWNPGTWGLGWQIDSVGKMVNHGGGAAGIYLSFTRYIAKHQTAIVFSISRELLSRPVANDALKVLNGESIYPKRSAAYEYGKILIGSGKAAADVFLEKAKKDTALYQLSESEFNALGYDLMGDSFYYYLPAVHHYPEALQVFKLNTQLFPNSWNTYDSYGEALAKIGNKLEAILMYKKSVELNPQNKGGIEALKKLE